jgi:hypothetical protein
MSTRAGRQHTRISGHTGPNGGGIDAHTERVMGEPGPYDGPMDGRVIGYAEPEGEERVRPKSTRARMMPPTYATGNGDGRSVVDLIRQISTESGNLVRQEVELAKAEMREKLGVFQRSIVSIVIGGVLLLAALLTGLWALNTGLTALLAQVMALDIAVWLSPSILTVALGGIGWSMIGRGRERMAEEGLVPRRTTTTLREDKRWAQEKMHEIKEELTHGR